MEKRLAQLCEEVDEAIAQGIKFIVLSDRDSNSDMAPIPSLMMVSTVHHHSFGQKTAQGGNCC
jgi:glutamate synthase (NADPH/NADH) large chain